MSYEDYGKQPKKSLRHNPVRPPVVARPMMKPMGRMKRCPECGKPISQCTCKEGM